MIEKSS